MSLIYFYHISNIFWLYYSLDPTSVPTTTQHYWNEQNKNRPTSKPVWTPAPATSEAPSEDQCRGSPCDYVGECRSRLGFCGEGVVYCNSASSWIPECGGGGSLIQFEKEEEPDTSSNTIPTASPINAWEQWVSKRDDDETDDSSDGSKWEAVEKEEEEEIESYWASWESGGGWNVRGRNTSTRYEYSLPIKVVLWTVVLFVI